jgi:hypothetical protein
MVRLDASELANCVQEVSRWNPAQLATLRRCALTYLFRMAPLCADRLQELNGPAVLLQFVKHADNLQHIESALRVLRHLVQSHRQLGPVLGSCEAVSISRSRFQDADMPQDLRQEAVATLHALCTGCKENLQRMESEGVVVAVAKEIHELRDVEPLLPNYFVIEMVSFMWTIVMDSPSALKTFLLASGKYPRPRRHSSPRFIECFHSK